MHESWEGNKSHISWPTSPCYAKPARNLEQNWVTLWLLWPKKQLCRILHYKSTNKYSWLVHQRGRWVLAGGSKTSSWPSLSYSTKPTPILGQNWVIWWLFEPKSHLCRIAHYKCTYLNWFVVHQRGTWVLGGGAKTKCLTNLATLYQTKTNFGAKLSSGVGYFHQNATI